ncbi:MAG: hypothetical protein IJK97_01615, partial [Thermoguttaceae bacterium]|nr:hypothetical protein [Thermoguttaceae bacterium]
FGLYTIPEENSTPSQNPNPKLHKIVKEPSAKPEISPASTLDLNTDFHGLKRLKGFSLERFQPISLKIL